MSIEAFLDLIRQRFSPAEGKLILEALTQDPLVWQFIQDKEQSLPYFDTTADKIEAFKPGSIALWLIQKEMGISLPSAEDLSQAMPDPVRQRAAKAFQTVINTGLPPTNLHDAGLLALTLRERRLIKGSWQGISEELFKSQLPSLSIKHFHTWRTPFACLFSFMSDIDGIVEEFTSPDKSWSINAGAPIFLHALLANPRSRQSQEEAIFTFSKFLPIDGQLTNLQWLENFERIDLQLSLARHLMQTRENQTFFSNLFSELEGLNSTVDGIDPLEKPIPFSLPERLNRLAAFHYFSGNHEKAAETYQQSSDLIKSIEAQTRFQALAIQGTHTSPSAWMKIVGNLPNSHKAHLFHIKSLIENRNFLEAREQLTNLPDSSEKSFLETWLARQSESANQKGDGDQAEITFPPRKNSLPPFGFFVRKPDLVSQQEITRALAKINNPQIRVSLIKERLADHPKDPAFIAFARDEYAKTGMLHEAIDLASYLERLEPDEPRHQRALASLYNRAERWQDAYSLLQKLIRNVSDPEMADLEGFAKSALMTGRIDMAISICQNILKKDETNPQAMILLGKAFMEQGDVVKAIQHMEKVVSLVPDDPQTWINLARFWENTGQTDRAFEVLRQGILAAPEDPDLLFEIGTAHLEKASPTEARGYLRKAFEMSPSEDRIRLNLARAEYQLGNFEKSLELCGPWSGAYKSNSTIARLLGNLYLALGKTEKAKPVLLSAAQQNPSDLATVIKTAELVLEPNSKDTLIEDQGSLIEDILKTSLKEHPEQAQLLLCLADLDRILGNYQEAHDRYTQLAMNKDEYPEIPAWRVQYGLGLTSSALGDLEIGLAALEDAAHSEPDNLKTLQALATTYASADLIEKALESAQSALDTGPRNIENLIWYASFCADNNQLEKAQHALKEASKLAPERMDVKYLHAKTLSGMNAAAESLALLKEIVANDETSPGLLHQSGYLYLHEQQLGQAVSAFEKALEKSEAFQPLLTMDLAVLHTLMDGRKRALELLDLPEETLRQFPQMIILRADLLSEIGQYAAAAKTLELLEGNFADSLNQPVNNPESVAYSPLLSRFDFSPEGYWHRYGQLLRATGAFAESQTVLEKAYSSEMQDSKILNALVSLYSASLKNQEALKILEGLQIPGGSQDGMNFDQLDLICTQVEMFMDLEDEVRISEVLNHPAICDCNYPRFLALKSKQAARKGDTSLAADFLHQALDQYQKTMKESNPASPSVLFRIQANLQAIADASLECKDFKTAHQYQHDAWKRLNNQPIINLHYVRLILSSAESQQVAYAVKVLEHAPGSEFLDDKYYKLGKGLLDELNATISGEEVDCLQARLSSAFTGSWPSHLTVANCSDSPEASAAYILGCDDENQVSDILKSFPESLNVLRAAAVFTLKTSKGDGKSAIEKALQIDTADPINHALLGLLNRNDPVSSAKSFETALQFWPDEPEWHRILADLYTELGNTDKAADHITMAIQAQPQNSAYWQTRAGIHLQLNQLEEAKLDLEKSTELESQDPAGWLSMADVNRRLGNLNAAAENINTAVTLKPDDSDIAIQEIKFLLDRQQYRKAEEKAAQGLKKHSGNKHLRILLAQTRAKLGEFDQALEILTEQETNQNQKDPSLVLETLKIKKERDGIETILPELIQLAEQHPDHPDVLTTLTDWLIQTNRLNEAQEAAQTILRIIPDSAEVHLMLGRLQRMNGQLDQAIAHLSEAIAYDPDLVDAYIELGKTYQNRQNLEEAIKIFQMGTRADASDPRPYYHAGIALKSCKDYSGAEEMLKQAKKYAPNDANIIRQLGVITALNLINNLRETR